MDWRARRAPSESGPRVLRRPRCGSGDVLAVGNLPDLLHAVAICAVASPRRAPWSTAYAHAVLAIPHTIRHRSPRRALSRSRTQEAAPTRIVRNTGHEYAADVAHYRATIYVLGDIEEAAIGELDQRRHVAACAATM
jgi:hypothetical protein